MPASPLDSRLHSALLGDRETAALFTDAAEIEAMITVERALARAGARAGCVPEGAAHAIDVALDGLLPPPQSLAAGTASAGVPVPALLGALRQALPPEVAHWLHWGATSQDIVDTALVLRLVTVIDGFAARLDRLLGTLEAQSARWRTLPMAARTRSQVATPTTFGLRIARWAQPLIALEAALPAHRAAVARVQFGGAAGTGAAVTPHGSAITEALAAELHLAPAAAWHTDRTGLAGLACWCVHLDAALAKMAQDLILMGRSESGEAAAGSGGGSSAMPQKSNPVAAETLLALARFAALLAPALQAPHAEERDGAAWSLEWLTLPQIVIATGACLRHAQDLAASLAPEPSRMAAVLGLGGGAVMAEAARVRLSETLARDEAERLVKDALADIAAGDELIDALARRAPDIDWREALDRTAAAAPAAAAAEAVFATRARRGP